MLIGLMPLALASSKPVLVHAIPIVGAVVEGWGLDSDGQLGTVALPPTAAAVAVATPLSRQLGVSGIAAGGAHSLAVESGELWGWGRDYEGELGDGASSGGAPKPMAVEAHTGPSTLLRNIVAVEAGTWHTLALDGWGSVWAMGSNKHGQLGNGTTTDSAYAVEVMTDSTHFLTNVVAIAAGGFHSMALDSNGNMWAWGSNLAGQLGNNSLTDSSYAVQVEATSTPTYLSNVTDIAAGYNHSLAIKNDGTVWAWGNDTSGQLGDNTLGDTSCNCRELPVQVKDGASSNLATGTTTPLYWPRHRIAGGESHSIVVKSDGTAWAWGSGVHGQLGNGTTADSPYAVAVTSSITGSAQSVAAGGDHSLALRGDGTVMAWGDDYEGELGDGTTLGDPTTDCYCRTSPMLVPGVARGFSIAGGGRHSLVAMG